MRGDYQELDREKVYLITGVAGIYRLSFGPKIIGRRL